MQFKLSKVSIVRYYLLIESSVAAMEEVYQVLSENITETLVTYTKYAGREDFVFLAGDKVWPLTRNIQTSRSLRNLEFIVNWWV